MAKSKGNIEFLTGVIKHTYCITCNYDGTLSFNIAYCKEDTILGGKNVQNLECNSIFGVTSLIGSAYRKENKGVTKDLQTTYEKKVINKLIAIVEGNKSASKDKEIKQALVKLKHCL